MQSDVLLVPLRGHTHGHAGVAVRSDGRWHLLAGDAYFHHAEMDPLRPHSTPGLRFYQWMMEKDRGLRLSNQARLRELRRSHAGEVDIFCSHDVLEFERLSGRAAGVPADTMSRSSLLQPARPSPAVAPHLHDDDDDDASTGSWWTRGDQEGPRPRRPH